MKILIYVSLIISISLIVAGYIINDINSEKLIGSGTLLFFFVVMPLFLYHRGKNKKLKDFILNSEDLNKLNKE